MQTYISYLDSIVSNSKLEFKVQIILKKKKRRQVY